MTDTRVRFLDLQAHYAGLRSEIQRAVDAVFTAQAFVLGPAVAEFEAAVGGYLGGVHVVGVASGTCTTMSYEPWRRIESSLIPSTSMRSRSLRHHPVMRAPQRDRM